MDTWLPNTDEYTIINGRMNNIIFKTSSLPTVFYVWDMTNVEWVQHNCKSCNLSFFCCCIDSTSCSILTFLLFQTLFKNSFCRRYFQHFSVIYSLKWDKVIKGEIKLNWKREEEWNRKYKQKHKQKHKQTKYKKAKNRKGQLVTRFKFWK